MIHLEKTLNKVDRDTLWKVLCIYTWVGKLLEVVRSFSPESKARVRVGIKEGKWFQVRAGRW